MNIRAYLDYQGLHLYQLAEILQITRPTLNRYIKNYELGLTLKQPYQSIFDDLFGPIDLLSHQAFQRKLEKIKTQGMLLARYQEIDALVNQNETLSQMGEQREHRYWVVDQLKQKLLEVNQLLDMAQKLEMNVMLDLSSQPLEEFKIAISFDKGEVKQIQLFSVEKRSC